MTALSDALREANNKRGLSTRQIAEMGGGLVSDATITQYMSGQHPHDPDDDVLKTFAAALGISVRWLRELASQPQAETLPLRRESSDQLLTMTQNVQQPDEFEADPDAAYRQKWQLADDADRGSRGTPREHDVNAEARAPAGPTPPRLTTR